MKRAILHIGTEKTGSTSIQRFLHLNRRRLARGGWLYPETAGRPSNNALVVHAKDAPEPDLLPSGLDATDPVALADWKVRFVVEHCEEVLPFLRSGDATLVYSSEHMQSRLCDLEEIRRVARLLRALVDEVRVVVWLRRQDRFALSAHGTAVKAGSAAEFDFAAINARGPYYDYRLLLDNWAGVFGDASMTVRVFERERLIGGDVVNDFRASTGVGARLRGLREPEAENRALSVGALGVLRAYNAGRFDAARLDGFDAGTLRAWLIRRLETEDDPWGALRPAREEAVAFQSRFDAANAEVAERWLGGEGFDASFDAYPERAAPEPSERVATMRLERLVDEWLGSRLRRSA